MPYFLPNEMEQIHTLDLRWNNLQVIDKDMIWSDLRVLDIRFNPVICLKLRKQSFDLDVISDCNFTAETTETAPTTKTMESTETIETTETIEITTTVSYSTFSLSSSLSPIRTTTLFPDPSNEHSDLKDLVMKLFLAMLSSHVVFKSPVLC